MSGYPCELLRLVHRIEWKLLGYLPCPSVVGHNSGFNMTVHPDFDSDDDLTVSGVPVPLIALSVTENVSTDRLPTPHLEIANAPGVSSDSTGFSNHLRSVDSPALPLPITCSAYRWAESWDGREVRPHGACTQPTTKFSEKSPGYISEPWSQCWSGTCDRTSIIRGEICLPDHLS